MMKTNSNFQTFVTNNAKAGNLVVQPRMGFSDVKQMRDGLITVKETGIPTIGTITIDSFTRTGDFESAKNAIVAKQPLNGYPIVSYSANQNKQLIDGIRDINFPLQVRHGSPLPQKIFEATIQAGIDAIEGGPISYCFPYGRTPLQSSIEAWEECCEMYGNSGNENHHVESFGGCMMGQLSPPSMLIAVTVIEAIFFVEHGIKSLSVSLAQGSNVSQDIAAIRVLRKMCDKYLKIKDWHIVFYTFMGKFPQTFNGAKAVMTESAKVAKIGGAERLIVKTVKEAYQIPNVSDNVDALKWCFEASQNLKLVNYSVENAHFQEQLIYEEADFLIDMVLNYGNNISENIHKVFQKGFWDIPYCLHPDNHKKTRTRLNNDGVVLWANTGKIPFPNHLKELNQDTRLSSSEFLKMLSFNQEKFDNYGFLQERIDALN